MINLRKIITIILVATIICSNSQGLISYANEVTDRKSEEIISDNQSKIADIKAPVLDVESININKREVKPGDTINISARISDDISGIKYVYLYYKTPITGKLEYINMLYNNETDRYEGSLDIKDNLEDGLWQINHIYMCDNLNNEVYIYNSNVNSWAKEVEDLSKGDFTISGTNADIKAPVLDVESIKINQREVKPGDTLNVSARISDDISGIKYVYLYYKTPITGKLEYINMLYNNETDRYEGSLDIKDNLEDGLWQINHIYMCDNLNNEVYIYNSNVNSSGKEVEDLSKGDFTISGTSADIKAPVLDVESIRINKREVKPGDTINISARISDDISGIKYVYLYYKTPITGKLEYINMLYNNETDRYEGSLDIEDNLEDGLWQINHIYMCDNSNNEVYIYNSNVNSSGKEVEDLSKGDFEVVPDNNSTTPIQDITVVTKNTSWSNKTINGDLYIGPNAVLTINSNVTVTGNVYVLGALKTYGGLCIDGTLYGNRMIWGSTSTLYNGTVIINGSNYIYSMNMSDYPVQDIPLRIDTTPLIANNGKLDIKGATLDIADMYIENQLVELDYRGRFDLSDLYIGNKDIITIKFKTVFGNTITKEISLDNHINKMPEISAKDVVLKVDDVFNAMSGVSASDKEDGDITSKIKVAENTVNTSKAGIYKVVYEVIDSDGNTVRKEIKVTVRLNKVSNVKSVSNSYNSNKITWSKLKDVDGYEIYRSTSKTGTYSRVQEITNGNTINYVDKNLATGSGYYYKIRAYKIVNGEKLYGDYSSIVSAKPVLSRTTNVISKSASYNSNKITWKKVSGASGYEVYRSNSKSGKYSKVKTITSGSTLNYTNTGLTTGTTYYYKVRAYRTVNGKKVYSSYSSIVSAKPTLKTPSVKLTSGSRKATVKWGKVAGASGYEVYRATSKSGKYSKVKTVGSGSTTSYTNSSLTKNKTYYYKVRAYRTVKGKKVYSSYSSAKYIKIK